MTTTESAWISPETRNRLQDEVEQLIRQRSTVGIDVAQTRSRGDLDNNDGYHRATITLDRIDSRIAQLHTLLSTANTTTVSDGTVQPGSTVTVMFDNDRLDTATFLLALPEEHETGTMQVCSPRSPLGTALRGAQVGDERRYNLPNGDECTATVLECVPFLD